MSKGKTKRMGEIPKFIDTSFSFEYFIRFKASMPSTPNKVSMADRKAKSVVSCRKREFTAFST